MRRRHFTTQALAAMASWAMPWSLPDALAAEPGPGGYPERPIRIVVPYPAGGIVDAVIRTAAEPLSADLPQRVLTENRPGADGRIGIDAVAKAAADGYTLLACSPLLSTGEHLMPEMKGRSRDFAGICGIAAAPAVFVVTSGMPVKSLKEFVALASGRPGEFNAANPGTGSSIHLGQELFFEGTGLKLTNVNYKGQPPSLLDLGSGQVHFALISQNLVLPLIQSGRVRALAVNAAKRTRSLPEVPTVIEAGFPDVLVQSWYGVAAPARTPAAIVAYLSQQFQRALSLPDTRARLEAMDAEILAYDGPRLDQLIDSEYRRWGELIRKRRITM